MKYSLFTFFIFTISYNISFTQQWKNYTNKDYVSCMLQAKDGSLWVGTFGGVLKYDAQGKLIAEYNRTNGLGANNVNCITQDKNNNIWVGHSRGISKFNGQVWEAKDIGETITNTKIFHGSPVNNIIEDKDGIIWCGLSPIDSKTYNPISSIKNLPSTSTNGLVITSLIDKNGTLWLGTTSGILLSYSNNSWTIYNNLKNSSATNSLNCITQDKNGDLWIGTSMNGVYKYDGKTWTNFTVSNSGIIDNNIKSILQDKEGKFWFGLASSGVSQYNGTRWVTFNNNNAGFLSNEMTSILEDNSGVIYFSNSKGISKYSNAWSIFKKPNNDIGSNYVNSITQDKAGSLFFGTLYNGVSKFNNSSWSIFNTSNLGLISNNVNHVFIDKDNLLWIGDWTNGFYRSDGLTLKSGDRSDAIFQDNSGSVWIATNGSIYKYTENKLVYSKKFGSIMSGIAQDKAGNIWASTDSKLYKYDGTTWNIFPIPSPIVTNSNYFIENFLIDKDDNIWITFYGLGVYKYDGKTWIDFNSSNSGLFDNLIRRIYQDRSGNIWFGGREGVFKFDGINWTNYNTNNSGIADLHVNAIFQDKDDNMWFGTPIGGASVFSCSSIIPTVIKQPISQNITEKQLATFQIVTSNANTFQWQESNDNGVTWKNVSIIDMNYSGVQSDKLIIKEVKISQNGYQYRCLLTNICANNTSGTAILSVSLILNTTNLSNNDLYIYPNPANESINISVPFRDFKIDIIDARGITIKQIENQNVFSIQDLPSGTYYLQISSKELKSRQKLFITR